MFIKKKPETALNQNNNQSNLNRHNYSVNEKMTVYHQRYEMVVLSGINTVSFHGIDNEGELTTDEEMNRLMTN